MGGGATWDVLLLTKLGAGDLCLSPKDSALPKLVKCPISKDFCSWGHGRERRERRGSGGTEESVER